MTDLECKPLYPRMNVAFSSGFPRSSSDAVSLISRENCSFSKEFETEGLGYSLHLDVLSDGLVHVGYSLDHVLEAAVSYGVSSYFCPESVVVKEEQDDDFVELVTRKLRIRIRCSDLSLSFISVKGGEFLSQDCGGVEHYFDQGAGAHRQMLRKTIRENELFFGLGDKPCPGNLCGRRFEFWGADHYAYHENSDPLYKNIPFFIGLENQLCYGIFLDNTGRSSIDLGRGGNHILLLEVPGDRMDYYFFHEASPLEVVASYTRLTGLPELPPMWALGYQQSKWSYYPAEVVRNVAESIRKHKIPCDAIYLDIDHLKDKCVFTWDNDRFPDPSGMIRELDCDGIKVITIVNPGVKIEETNSVWKEGMEKGYYCLRGNGDLVEEKSWPGLCHFPDFTRRDVRGWWAGLFREYAGEKGVSGIWADMNEPSVFPDRTFPEDTIHDYDGYPCSHGMAHNIYGHCMADSCKEGMLGMGGRKRPFVLSRSGYSGMQRFAATWTGDNCSTWEHLTMANAQCQRLSSSGISFCGSDVGGFIDYPTPELFCRWMQLGAFHMLYRNHASKDYGGQEPWVFGQDVTDYVRDAVETRYKLLPYLYTVFQRYCADGMPAIRPVALQCVHEPDTSWRDREFFVGDHLYVVPVLEKQAVEVSLYVPQGTWFSLWNDKPLTESGGEESVDVSLAHIPVFVRGGAVLPLWPVQQYVGQIKRPDVTLHLWWADDTECESSLYEDSGDGFEYQSGNYRLHHFSFSSRRGHMVLTCHREGGGHEFHGKTSVALHSLPVDSGELACMVDGNAVSFRLGERKCVVIDLPEDFEKVELNW